MKACAVCGEMFAPRNNRQKYCGDECYRIGRNALEVRRRTELRASDDPDFRRRIKEERRRYRRRHARKIADEYNARRRRRRAADPGWRERESARSARRYQKNREAILSRRRARLTERDIEAERGRSLRRRNALAADPVRRDRERAKDAERKRLRYAMDPEGSREKLRRQHLKQKRRLWAVDSIQADLLIQERNKQ